MSWETWSLEERAAAEAVCTPKEIEALKLKAAGYGLRAIARILGIDRSSARDRLDRAERKINQALSNG